MHHDVCRQEEVSSFDVRCAVVKVPESRPSRVLLSKFRHQLQELDHVNDRRD